MRDLARDPVARLVLLAALLIRLAFFLEVERHELDLSSSEHLDMIFLHRNARKIADGDVRLVSPFLGHYEDVRTRVVGPERYDRLYAKGTYFDSPGYLYFAALCEKVSGRSPYAVIFAQLVLDGLGCAFVYVFARRTFGLATGRVALAAAGLCLESVAEAGFVLRESFLSFLATASFLALAEARRKDTPRGWVLAGAVLGAGWASKSSFTLLLLAAPLLVRRDDDPEAASARRRVRAGRLARLAVGAALAISPFVARNVSLGVPPFAMSTVVLNAIVGYNAPGYSGAALWFNHEQTHELIERSEATALGATPLGAWLTTVRAFPDPAADYPALLARKLHYFWAGVDFWNNIRCSWLRLLSPVLGACVVWWGVLGPWCALGLALVVSKAKRRREAAPLVAVFLALGLAAALVSGVFTRYRMVVAPAACVFFAVAVVDAARLLRARGARSPRDRLRSRAAGAGLVLAGLALHVILADPRPPEARTITRPMLHGYVLTWKNDEARRYLDERVDRSSAPD